MPYAFLLPSRIRLLGAGLAGGLSALLGGVALSMEAALGVPGATPGVLWAGAVVLVALVAAASWMWLPGRSASLSWGRSALAGVGAGLGTLLVLWVVPAGWSLGASASGAAVAVVSGAALAAYVLPSSLSLMLLTTAVCRWLRRRNLPASERL